MALNFPNHSRSYDPQGYCVRFWGHDGAMEVAFFLEESALFRIDPQTRRNETGLLNAFDAHRDRIIAAAGKVYAGKRRRSYLLVASDF